MDKAFDGLVTWMTMGIALGTIYIASVILYERARAHWQELRPIEQLRVVRLVHRCLEGLPDVWRIIDGILFAPFFAPFGIIEVCWWLLWGWRKRVLARFDGQPPGGG